MKKTKTAHNPQMHPKRVSSQWDFKCESKKIRFDVEINCVQRITRSCGRYRRNLLRNGEIIREIAPLHINTENKKETRITRLHYIHKNKTQNVEKIEMKNVNYSIQIIKLITYHHQGVQFPSSTQHSPV